jgi:hypothetical protein
MSLYYIPLRGNIVGRFDIFILSTRNKNLRQGFYFALGYKKDQRLATNIALIGQIQLK